VLAWAALAFFVKGEVPPAEAAVAEVMEEQPPRRTTRST
jgi:hypothetical protein